MGDGFRINLVGCTDAVLQEIGAKETMRRDIALTYAMSIKSEAQGADKPDWRKINEAILSRWSRSGLEYIKKRAFDLLAGKVPL